MIIEMGVNAQTVHFQWEKLYTENRKIIDPISNRYFLVGDPVEITLDKLLVKTVKAPLLPGKRKYRKIPVTKKIFVEKIDFVQNRGKEVRLMHFCNIILDNEAKVMDKALKDVPKIHWVSSKNFKVRVIMPDGKEVDGLAEPGVAVQQGNRVQRHQLFCFRIHYQRVYLNVGAVLVVVAVEQLHGEVGDVLPKDIIKLVSAFLCYILRNTLKPL